MGILEQAGWRGDGGLEHWVLEEVVLEVEPSWVMTMSSGRSGL